MSALPDVSVYPPLLEPSFTVAHQKVDLEIDFATQSLRGKTEIEIYPDSTELRHIRLNARQLKLKRLNINGKTPQLKYTDPYSEAHVQSQATVRQHHLLWQKLEPHLRSHPEANLVISVPRTVRIEEVRQPSYGGQIPIPSRPGIGNSTPEIGEQAQTTADTTFAKFTPLKIYIEYVVKDVKDALHFVGCNPSSGQYPHVYTENWMRPGSACALFPCVDDLQARCTWDISIKVPTTLATAFAQRQNSTTAAQNQSNDTVKSANTANFNKELVVLCSGEETDDIQDKLDPTKRVVSFSTTSLLAARQIGFAVGPFEHLNLAEFRDSQEDDQLGQNAMDIHAYCLPGRMEELRNTCLPMARAIDFMTKKYGSCPFSTYNMCFVDDATNDTNVTASLTICSNRLLLPEGIIDPSESGTRELVHAIAWQYAGINIVPKEDSDWWVIFGISGFMTDTFMRDLCGVNEYRYRMKLQSAKVCELDYERPSLAETGSYIHVDPFEMGFMALKAPLVLFILDRRIAKITGTTKMPNIISRIFIRSTTGEISNGALSTDMFQKTCEKFYHAKIDDFLNQWVRGGGCPKFHVAQRFNKKKLVVEMSIKQMQAEQQALRPLQKDSFIRDVKEDLGHIYAAPPQPVFTGPMTIRIHEADGTPYEHIVDLKEAYTRFEIPYNTKYKRLKRGKKQREKGTNAQIDGADGADEVLLYSLGDVLQSEEEIAEWKITEWSKEEEDKMNQESYEWIRLDADFEWIADIRIVMPGYMFLSQLQQDRDIVAQLESVQHICRYEANPLISSIILRTVMDRRYFHGIRTTAAKGLVKHATESADFIGLHHLKKIFEEYFCLPGSSSKMTRPNNFSDLPTYLLQCIIPETIAKIRDSKGMAPQEVMDFLLDKMRFNDNSVNPYSDCYYVATLMRAITDALISRKREPTDDPNDDFDYVANQRLAQNCMSELDRYRRMDEWNSSFQNIYSRTALECQRRLVAAGMADLSVMHFLQYTRPQNLSLLRLAAFESVIDDKFLRKPEVLSWFLYTMSMDHSPWLRAQLRRSFGIALASAAIGEDVAPETMPAQDELVVEGGPSAQEQRANAARKETVEGAIAALREELQDNDALAHLIWNAVTSPRLGLLETHELLVFAHAMYEPVTAYMVNLRLPRYWKVKHLGQVSCDSPECTSELTAAF